MNIQQWQAHIREQLTESTALLQRMVPGMSYGALATATLLPVVAAVKGGDITAITGLYTLLGNVGAGLVTNLIQEWKDREEAETLAELPQAITAQIAADDEAQTAFDKLINELETVRLTLESGALPDPAAFVDALRAELTQLGSTVEVHGDWITVGDVTGSNLVVGRNNTLTTIGTQHNYYESPPDPSKPDPTQLHRAYLNWVYEQSDMLSLAGVDPKAKSGEAHLSLGAVYTALLTMTPEDHERWLLDAEGAQREARMADRAARRLSAIELLNRHQHLVLLGDPGSGKSTLVNFVALCLAGEGLQKRAANVQLLTAPLPVDDEEKQTRNRSSRQEEQERQPWSHDALLPVRVILRDFAARGLPAPGLKATADHLWTFICAELPGDALGDYTPLLHNELRDRGGLLLLDGLDEVPDAGERRSQIKQAVEEFVTLFPQCRVLVTSRTYAYQQQEWRLRGFTETILAPFSDSQIKHFVDRWYAHMATVRSLDRQDAQGRAELLKRAIFAAPRLHELAERPLLLTLTASIHAWRGGTLPDRREELYDAAVDLLLDWWESQRVVRDETGKLLVVQPSLVEWLRADREAIRAVLNRLAFAAHKGQPRLVGTADIPEKELVYALFETSDDQATDEINEKKLIEYLSQRAGLLVPRGVKVYTFPHRTFQEYLAACHLTDDEYPEQVADLVRNEPIRWREVTLLAGAKAVRGTSSAIWNLIDELCYRDPEETDYALADDWGALLAGQALLESANLEKVSERNQRRVDHVKTSLLHALRNSDFPAIERAAAGRALAKLGDPRPAVLASASMQFCYVPAGPFIMGSDPDKENMARSDEQPQHELTIDYGYWISRFPVTNAQFAEFMADGGYTNAAYWTEAIAHGYWKDGRFRDEAQPRQFGEPFDLPNHPVVGISWYEALAYARWLTANHVPAGWQAQLPSEAEWEKAARGGLQIPQRPLVTTLTTLPAADQTAYPAMDNPQPTRRYPWGHDIDPERCSYSETNLGSTSAVGAFAAGAGPYGAEELSGTVWEWTRSVWYQEDDEVFKYPYNGSDGREDLDSGNRKRRVWRGGAFVNGGSGARAAYRVRNDPHGGDNVLGVRIVCCPHPL